MRKFKTLYKVAYNDADYPVITMAWIRNKDGNLVQKEIMCPIFAKWSSMVSRCYSKAFRDKNKCYENVTLCADWHYFSKFRNWMLQQDWENYDLDKDLLSGSQKVYSPETCAFIPASINRAFSKVKEKTLPIGVTASGTEGKFVAAARKYIGTFNTPAEAHRAWQECKIIEIEKLIKEYRRMKCYRKDVHKALTNIQENIRIDFKLDRNTTNWNSQEPLQEVIGLIN